ncbi:serine hydrolase domain-containing protein [Streptomyces sp. BA2]|uniref:serine hydrolase domain-containing protein n=1 Tax=Streptomyces sp. BA2 TaxID=436595 RepID=UPI0013206D9B|nr:serine hydrolase domain-containing protein [Streptomyces sp. BA2]MWA11142.1 serine hydrolase [Streptomyces sp. BA2]
MPVRRRGLMGVAAGVAMTVAAGAFAAPALAGESGRGAGHGDRHRATQKAMEAAVNEEAPGVTVQVKDRHGTWNSAAGIGDVERQSPRGGHDHYRVGSISKTFLSTVVLQLVAEGELSLDDKVGRWLPGVVEGNGHDGDRITVRQLLNHTSGIYDVLTDPGVQDTVFTEKFLAHRYDTWTPEQHVAIAMRHEPDFDPGEGWNYSNTNYILAGLIIEKVTGEAYADEIRRRIVEPLDLGGTSVPPSTDFRLPEPSSRAYMKLSGAPDATTHDVTELNPSLMGASGGVISNSADLNRFNTALLRGKLLPKKQLAEMKRTVPQGEGDEDEGYGLGLVSRTTKCGTVVWGNGGDVHGSTTMMLSTEDGRHALTANFNSMEGDLFAILNAEFCGK